MRHDHRLYAVATITTLMLVGAAGAQVVTKPKAERAALRPATSAPQARPQTQVQTLAPSPAQTASSTALGQQPRPSATRTPRGSRDLQVLVKDQLQTPAARRETPQERRAKLIARCETERPNAAFKIKGLRLSARGTDVDEIYGAIAVTSTTTRGLKITSRARIRGWSPNMLWSSNGENRNLGKYPETFFNEVTVPIRHNHSGGTADLIVELNVRDEDGPRGGDDEYFYVGKDRDGHPLSTHSIVWQVPTCPASPEFIRTARMTINGRAPGSASGNVVSFQFDVEMSRKVDQNPNGWDR